jgi:NAD-reducing hydrogenase large subunit
MSRKITIDPITRVEGHGKVTIKLDDQNNVLESRLHIVEFRGFERFVQGRPYWEAAVLVQRLCGICPVSHHLCAAKAMDHIIGVPSDRLTPTGDKMRRLMHYGQFFQSHVLHFFHLASPDLLFGADADPVQRNIIGVISAFPKLAKKAVLMRKFGQEIIKVTAGKKVHGTGAIPGGINRHLTLEEKKYFLDEQINPDLNADKMVEWAQEGLDLFKEYHRNNRGLVDGFADFPSNYLSLVRKDGGLDLYHGGLRAVDHQNNKIFDHVDYQEYTNYLSEEVRNWTYMKFPFIKSLGPEKGWYRVGPLARLNTCDFIPTPRAQKEFEAYKSYSNGKPSGKTMHMHWARLIEILHSAEMIRDLLNDPDLYSGELVKTGTRTGEGVGVIEAPRGTLFHHYKVDPNDLITMCNLIVSTTSNNEAMNRSVNWVAKNIISGNKEIPEGMLNKVEIAIRAYDPCLSCATHAIGQMPLVIDLVDSNEKLIDQKIKNAE